MLHGASVFAEAVQRIGAKPRPTRGHRPQTNGKAERFIRTMPRGVGLRQPYRSNSTRLKALPS